MPSLPAPLSNFRPRLTRALLGLSLLAAPPAAGAVELGFYLPPPQPLAVQAPGLPACPPPTTPTELALWNATPRGEQALACGNVYGGHLRFPHNAANPSFRVMADEIAAARGEVLIANMDWEDHPQSPTALVLDGVARLYARVRAAPGEYPQGMRVRLQSGVIPKLDLRPDSMDQPIMLARELSRRGVPLQDPALGWDLRLNAYRYYPHSHAKFGVIDGRALDSGGYNFTRWFVGTQETYPLPQTSPTWGGGVLDERLTLRGPLALAGVWAFDDLWRHGQEWTCEDQADPDRCRAVPAVAGPHPDYARLLGAWENGEAGYSFSLYERPRLTHAQGGIVALLGAARQTLDLDQATISPRALCTFAHRWPAGCGLNTWPGYLKAIHGALKRGVQVRLLLNRADGEIAGNFATAALLVQQARLDGLEDRLSVRWHEDPERSHNKTVLVDGMLPGAVMLTGSINLHFSSFGSAPLVEHSLATSNPRAVAEARRYFEEHWARSVPVADQPWMVPSRR